MASRPDVAWDPRSAWPAGGPLLNYLALSACSPLCNKSGSQSLDSAVSDKVEREKAEHLLLFAEAAGSTVCMDSILGDGDPGHRPPFGSQCRSRGSVCGSTSL